MCGIFGMMLKSDCSISEAQRGVLTYILANENDRRGKDSWGFAAINEDNKILVRHGLGYLAPEAVQLFGYDRFMAHTRWATQGKKSMVNSHPFLIGRIVGAHNGCLWNHEELNRKYGRQCSVDSMHIMHHLDEGLDFDDLEGYGVIEWFEDNDPSAVYLCQLSKSGELCIVGIGPDSDNVEGVVWSSDERHLENALEAAGVEQWFKYDVRPEQVYYAKPEGLFFVKRRKLSLNESYSTYDYGSLYGSRGGATTGNFPHRSTWGGAAKDNGYYSRPANMSDEEWEEFKYAIFADEPAEDDDEDDDVHPEIRTLDRRLHDLVEEDEEVSKEVVALLGEQDGEEVEVEVIVEKPVWRGASNTVHLDDVRREATSKIDRTVVGEDDRRLLSLLDTFGSRGA